jgi:hypothetical protein
MNVLPAKQTDIALFEEHYDDEPRLSASDSK